MRGSMNLFRTIVASVALTAAPAAIAQDAKPASLGIGVVDQDGQAIVQVVVPNHTAAALGLQPGDVLVEADGKALANVEAVGAYSRNLKAGQDISLTVKREGANLVLSGKALAKPDGVEIGKELPQAQ